jgi:hypothetical protein
MTANSRTPEAEGLDVVVVGSFNPAIFHPEWFLRHGLIAEEDAKEATVNLVSREVSDVLLCGLRLVCISERLSLGTSNISQSARLQDLLLNIFTLLPHVPVTACGINPWVHYAISNTEYWHKIGHTLAPKELVWDDLLDDPGMQSLTIKAPHHGEFSGEVNVTVEPSSRFSPGVFVKSNRHFSVPANMIYAGAAERMVNFVKGEWEPACAMARRVAERIFEKIKLHNG